MDDTAKRLKSLRISEVMSTEVVSISSDQTMAEAAETFVRRQISGAPVIDEKGHCVGVLSATDFVCREEATSHASSSLSPCEHALVRNTPESPWRIEDVFTNRVCAHMTPAVQTVDPGKSLIDAGRVMCAERIHYLPVLDANAHPVGIITPLDFVGAVLQAIGEADSSSD